MEKVPFTTVAWSDEPVTEHPGESGVAMWRTRLFGSTRVRMVEYSSGYRADHWCSRGHVLLVLDGVLHTELADGRRFTLHAGDSYQVSDDVDAHRSSTEVGARLFIVD
jgi:quercetin dioxygenase-like cupin family protein